MKQLSLFDSPKPEPERRPPNQAFIRKVLMSQLRFARRAETLPWILPETISKRRQYPKLAALLPAEEGAQLLAAFEAEMTRLMPDWPIDGQESGA